MTGTKPYTVLFKRYWHEVFCYCRKRMGGDEDAAKDMAEFAFIKLWNNFATIVSDENAKAYLYVVARNACFNELQIKKRHHSINIDSVPALEYLLIDDPKWDYDMINIEIMIFIQQEIAKLPPMCKKVVELFIKGLTSDEIANHMNTTRKTALNQKLKGIGIIREHLKLRYG